MNITNSHVYKDDRKNWRGTFDITSDALPGRTLQVVASKNYSGVTVCSVYCGVLEKCRGYNSFTFVPRQDYYRAINNSPRCTSKNVEALLNEAREKAEELVKEAAAFYANKAPSEAPTNED